jgi:cytochrome c1
MNAWTSHGGALLIAALASTLAGTLALGGCKDDLFTKAAMVTGGDPTRGREEIRAHGCGACHTIPGVPGAHALVGPPLDHMASRAYVAGTLPNNPDNMREWIMHPQKVKPRTAMPDVGLTDGSARDITAFLYTLQ